MCGRYSLSGYSMNHRFEQVLDTVFEPVAARYNIAPGQDSPVIHLSQAQPTLELFRWGLVPHWLKEPKMKYSIINAEVEDRGREPV